MPPRLLISGSKISPHTLGTFICQSFPKSIEFEMLTFHDEFAKALRSKVNQITYRFFPGIVISRMNRLFIEQVKRFRPDVIVVFKGIEISKRALIEVRGYGIKLVNYNLDHPFFYESRGSGNSFVKEAIPYYDLHITYSSLIAKQLKDVYNVSTALLPFGYDLSDEEYEGLNETAKNQVCFIGNPDLTRVELIRFLTTNQVKVDVFGYRWDRFLKEGSYLKLHDQVVGNDYWKTIVRYRVQLNILRKQNEGSHNMRSFEVPAAGGIMLAQDTPEHRQYFEPGKEIFLYNDQFECLEKCRHIMTLGYEEALKIKLAARQRSVKDGYSYKCRSEQLINILKSI